MPVAAPIAGAVASGVVSKAMSGSGSGGSQSTDKSPWGPAQPFLENLVKDGQSLYSNYQQNPFSDAQKTAYQNQFTMNDQFNNQIMPGLMKGFQGLLGSNFGDISSGLLGGLSGATQRQSGAQQSRNYSPEQVQEAGQFIRQNIENPGLIQQRASQLGLSNADILQAAQTQDPNIRMNQVNQFMGRQDPQYARPSFGLLDFAQYSPWTSGTMQSAAQARAMQLANETPAERSLREQEEWWNMLRGAGGAGTGAGGDAPSGGAPGTGGSPGDSAGW